MSRRLPATAGPMSATESRGSEFIRECNVTNDIYSTVSSHKQVGFQAAALLILILGAPLNHDGRNSILLRGVNRQGCRFSRLRPWMAGGGGPTQQCRITGMPSTSEAPSGGARAFCLLLGSQKLGAVRAQPIAALTSKMDMHTIITNGRQRHYNQTVSPFPTDPPHYFITISTVGKLLAISHSRSPSASKF
jgi:hypothetical protein